MTAEDRHQDARVVHAADTGQTLRVAGRRRGQHAWASMHALGALRVENGHGTDVGLIQDLGQNAL